MKKILFFISVILLSCSVSKITTTQIYNLDDKIVSIKIYSNEPLFVSKQDSLLVNKYLVSNDSLITYKISSFHYQSYSYVIVNLTHTSFRKDFNTYSECIDFVKTLHLTNVITITENHDE